MVMLLKNLLIDVHQDFQLLPLIFVFYKMASHNNHIVEVSSWMLLYSLSMIQIHLVEMQLVLHL